MISDEYRKLNAELHERNEHYGENGHKFLPLVEFMLMLTRGNTVLDYGCGKNSLKAALLARNENMKVSEYDPAIPGCDAPPMAADIVVCNDVLEHVEPEHLNSVLHHIRKLARRGVVLTVCTKEAKKTLADGRNAHLSVHPASWWYPKLREQYGEVAYFSGNPTHFAVCFTV